MTDDTIHTCSYYCERPECIKRQRDELRDRMEAALASAQQQGQAVALPKLRRTHPDYSREEVQWVFGYNAALDDVMRLNKNTAPPPSAEAVAWLRMTPDGTPDWAEDCIGSDDRFLDPELASDGYYLQPLYTVPQQPAAVAAIRFALNDPEGMTFLRLWNEGEFDTIRREWPDAPSEVYVGADPLATKQQEPKP